MKYCFIHSDIRLTILQSLLSRTLPDFYNGTDKWVIAIPTTKIYVNERWKADPIICVRQLIEFEISFMQEVISFFWMFMPLLWKKKSRKCWWLSLTSFHLISSMQFSFHFMIFSACVFRRDTTKAISAMDAVFWLFFLLVFIPPPPHTFIYIHRSTRVKTTLRRYSCTTTLEFMIIAQWTTQLIGF